jgi:DNA invertase Pin-like site-specific DNA recombinase
MMLIGYARVSTADQNLALQKEGLEQAGCERIYEDTITSTQNSLLLDILQMHF